MKKVLLLFTVITAFAGCCGCFVPEFSVISPSLTDTTRVPVGSLKLGNSPSEPIVGKKVWIALTAENEIIGCDTVLLNPKENYYAYSHGMFNQYHDTIWVRYEVATIVSVAQ